MIRLLLGTSFVIAFALGVGCKRDPVEKKGAWGNSSPFNLIDAH